MACVVMASPASPSTLAAASRALVFLGLGSFACFTVSLVLVLAGTAGSGAAASAAASGVACTGVVASAGIDSGAGGSAVGCSGAGGATASGDVSLAACASGWTGG